MKIKKYYSKHLESQEYAYHFPIFAESEFEKKGYDFIGFVKFHYKKDYLEWLRINKDKLVNRYSKSGDAFIKKQICGRDMLNPHRTKLSKKEIGVYCGKDYIQSISL